MIQQISEILAVILYFIVLIIIVIPVSFQLPRLQKKKNINILMVQMFIFASNIFFVELFFQNNKSVKLVFFSCSICLIVYLVSRIKIIGLTGGIGCGKSTVSNYLVTKYKLKIIDCDLISREIYEIDSPAYKQIIKTFGQQILDEQEKIDRTKLGKLVFNDKKKLKSLNKISHYYILKSIISKVYYIFFVEKETLAVLDAALLLENPLLKTICFPVLVVYLTEKEEQVKRILKRNPEMTSQEVYKRIESQIPTEEKIKRADSCLCNDQSQEALFRQVTIELATMLC